MVDRWHRLQFKDENLLLCREVQGLSMCDDEQNENIYSMVKHRMDMY